MNKLNLDITKYSCNELQEIFNIKKIITYEQVNAHFNTYKNNILNDNNLSLLEKDNMTNFLNKVTKKLSGSLDNTNFLTNNLIKDVDNNHPIIINPNSIAGLNAKSYDGRNVNSNDYPPGNINPINIKTIKKTVNIDTRFRPSYYSTLSSDFNLTLPEQFKKVVNMELTSIAIPLTIYSISEALKNNCFVIESSNISISGGNYSSHNDINNMGIDLCNNIVRAVRDSISSAGLSNIIYSIDPINGKSLFTNTGASAVTIYFNKDCAGKEDLDNPLPLKLGWLLGFRAGVYELDGSSNGVNSDSNSIESEGIVSIAGPKYIYLCVNDYTNAGNNSFSAAFSSSTMSPHIIARINYQSLVQSNGLYNVGQDDDFSDSINRTREYFGPVDIQKLHLQILDEYGRVINFNNMDWSCALTFNVLYD